MPASSVFFRCLRCLLKAAVCTPILLLLPPAFAATLNVPAQYGTIQAAVTAAGSGDTVLIADGTYTGDGNRDIDFGGKSLTVKSQNGASKTILDCGGPDGANSHRGFFLHSLEKNAVIRGLTIENGYVAENPSPGGAGLLLYNVGVTVQDCIIKNNTVVHGGGGGITIVSYDEIGPNTAPMIVTGCTLTGNTSLQGDGGGILNVNGGSGTIRITNCTLTGNTASTSGGGDLRSVRPLLRLDSGFHCRWVVSHAGSRGATACMTIRNTYPHEENVIFPCQKSPQCYFA